MRAGTLALAISMLFPFAAQASSHQDVLAKARQSVEAADYSLKGRLVRVDEGGKRVSLGISLKAHWFPNILRVLLEVTSPSEDRVHVLFEMRPNGRNTILIAHPGDAKPSELPFSKWTEGPLGAGFSYEDFLDVPYFWAGQKDEGQVKYGARECELIVSTPGDEHLTHFAQVKSWLDLQSAFPVYVEKTLKGTGMVKQFTYLGLRQNEGIWSASQIQGKIRGQSGSTLLIIDRGSPKAHLELKDFSRVQLLHF
ncbi:MAG: outer membrane lipoprotein-sorting protein [Acidobacteriota bacterium]|nr:outer membrane lipoprotein-sorting protein [Acidobacteriota bacterium]